MFSARTLKLTSPAPLLALALSGHAVAQPPQTEPQTPRIIIQGNSGDGGGMPPIYQSGEMQDALPSYRQDQPNGLSPSDLPQGLEELLRQNPGLIPPSFNGGNLFQEVEGAPLEEQEATVRKALADLEHEDPEIRRSACMILGKYSLPMARQGLFRAIHDPVANVRRTALVALLENRMQLMGGEAMEVLAMVGDEDVHIRRLASSALQNMSLSTPFAMKGGRTPVRSFLPEISSKLNAALLDNDLTVRRNMVAGLVNLRLDLDEATVTKLLADSDREIRLGMLSALSQVHPDMLTKLGGMLADDKEPLVREELVNQLARVRTPDTRALLEKLAKDPAPKVSMLARLVLFEMNPTTEGYRELLPILEEPGVSSEILRPLIYSASMLPPVEGREIIASLLKKRNPVYTADALTVYSSMISTMGQTDVSPVLPYMEDPVPAIRQAAFSVLTRAPESITDEQLKKLMASSHPDVRQQTVYLAQAANAENASEIALELLLDNNVDVRIAALRELVMQKVPDWEVMAAQSLKDDDLQMAQGALEVLGMQMSPEALKILETFIADNPDHQLAGVAMRQVEFMRSQMQSAPRAPRLN